MMALLGLLLIAFLLPCLSSTGLTGVSIIPGSYAAGYLPRPLRITFVLDNTLVSGDNVTITPHTLAGGSAGQPGKVFTQNIPTVVVTIVSPTTSSCSAAGVTNANSSLTITLSGSSCSMAGGSEATFSVTTSMEKNVYGDVLLFDLATSKDDVLLSQPGWNVTEGIVANSVTVVPTTKVTGARSQYFNVAFSFTAPLANASLVVLTASADVFLASPSSFPTLLFSASCTASYYSSTSTTLTLRLSLTTTSAYTVCYAINSAYLPIPQAYIAPNPAGGTGVIVNVATQFPTNNQSSMTTPQYYTTSETNLNVIQLTQIPSNVIVNTSFSSKYVYQAPSLNASTPFILTTVCDANTTVGTFVVFRYQSSDASSHPAVCLIPTFRFTNCTSWNITHSCQAASTTARKFLTLSVGAGTITETFVRTSSSGSGSSSDGGSDTALLWLLWLLLIPIFLLVWCLWRRRKARHQMEKHDSLLSPRNYPNPMAEGSPGPEAAPSAAAAAAGSTVLDVSMDRTMSSSSCLPVPSSTPIGQSFWLAKEAADP